MQEKGHEKQHGIAVGFHRCQNHDGHLLWHKGTLHGGTLDIDRVFFGLHMKGLHINTLREKAQEYIAAKLLHPERAETLLRVLEQEGSDDRVQNDIATEADVEGEGAPRRLQHAELRIELARREKLLQGVPK